MKSTKQSIAKDVFSYLLMISLLYVGIVSILAILFQSINFQFPDPLSFSFTGISQILRTSISSLVIVWPVFLLISWVINKDLNANPQKQDLWVRKWLLYLTLFIASITVIVDLIMLTNGFLGGELTARFTLKVLAVLAVAIATLWYFTWDLRRDVEEKTKVPSISAIVASIVLVGWVVAGFFIVGSPATQRQIRSDEQRISDLQSIQWQLTNYWQQKESLPENLDGLNDDISGFIVPQDPITNTAYEYTALEENTFELCATFEHGSLGEGRMSNASMYEPYSRSGAPGTWEHNVGRTCFERTIDPELYPPIK